MKVLILGPIDYPSIRKDLQLINYNNKVYSTYYAFEGMYAATTREGKMLHGGTTELLLYLSETMRDSEYDVCDILFGFVPKTKHVDKVICYNCLSYQERTSIFNLLAINIVSNKSFIINFISVFYVFIYINYLFYYFYGFNLITYPLYNSYNVKKYIR